jgi:hypothetical protein
LLALLVVLFVGGVVAARRRAQARDADLRAKIAAADRALAAASAQDRGWDRARLEAATRGALERERPGWDYDTLHLILVDDKPGTDQDRAQMSASGHDGDVSVVLVRHGDEWIAEQVG